MSEYDPDMLMTAPNIRSDSVIRGTFAGYMDGFSSLIILRTAVEMGIFDMTSEPVTVDEVCSAKGTDRDLTEMFLDSLAQLELLVKEGDRYVNSEAAALYLDPKSRLYQDQSLKGIFANMDKWTHLEERLKGGPEYIPRERFFGDRWIRSIAESCSGGGVGAIVDAVDDIVDLSEYSTFMDLGGGHALYTIGFVHRHPNLKGYVFDSPMMRQLAVDNSERYGVPLETISGDFYKDDLGGPYDVVFSSFNPSTTDIRMADRVYGCVREGGLLILRRHLPCTSTNSIRNLEWSLNVWEGKGKKNYSGSWLPTSEEYMDRLAELGMETMYRKDYDRVSELVVLKRP